MKGCPLDTPGDSPKSPGGLFGKLGFISNAHNTVRGAHAETGPSETHTVLFRGTGEPFPSIHLPARSREQHTRTLRSSSSVREKQTDTAGKLRLESPRSERRRHRIIINTERPPQNQQPLVCIESETSASNKPLLFRLPHIATKALK